jgi:putative Mg2+ transporter-C (MgtC) family protein
MDYEMVVRLLLAALWGGIVGAEREFRSKAAGLRTMIMISVGACFFTMMSSAIGSPGNPDRIASNIVTGVGFLGAGVIFRGDSRINGITTSATIWAVAAIGMGIGAGYYLAAGSACILVIFVLSILPYLEEKIYSLNQTKEYVIQTPCEDEQVSRYTRTLEELQLKFKIVRQQRIGDVQIITWHISGKAQKHHQLATIIRKDERVTNFEF